MRGTTFESIKPAVADQIGTRRLSVLSVISSENTALHVSLVRGDLFRSFTYFTTLCAVNPSIHSSSRCAEVYYYKAFQSDNSSAGCVPVRLEKHNLISSWTFSFPSAILNIVVVSKLAATVQPLLL